MNRRAFLAALAGLPLVGRLLSKPEPVGRVLERVDIVDISWSDALDDPALRAKIATNLRGIAADDGGYFVPESYVREILALFP